ncbi:hypothetical protein HHK36_029420 [Tetracentron sinense]|uniref:C2H2-type domain-containing protein n=1 Tax=Tetracentron sinense TaxID=13715 RepID=A0A834YET2_TETSI|nr:hypothetical protein HHK36_029420 [Tetracentron sinense]
MSNFTQEFEEDEEDLQILQQSSNDSYNPIENGGVGFTTTSSTSKKKRSLPGNPGKQTCSLVESQYSEAYGHQPCSWPCGCEYSDPDAEVVALSPTTLMATNRYMCEVCHKGFQRDQNLQLHRRGHNLPWKLKQRPSTTLVKKRVYICPEPSCVHHDPSRALGDLTGIKKHFCRKHSEKKWKCDKCSKRYAVQSDWKAHSKICGTREYRCDCGTIFSRKDSFVTHRAFCDALAEENYKVNQSLATLGGMLQSQAQELFSSSMPISNSYSNTNTMMNLSISNQNTDNPLRPLSLSSSGITFSSNSDLIFNPSTPRAPSAYFSSVSGANNTHMAIGSPYISATALLQKAAEMGAKISDNSISPIILRGFTGYSTGTMSSYGSLQEGSSIVDCSVGPVSASINGLYVGNQNAFLEKTVEFGNMDLRPAGSMVFEGHLLDSPLLMHQNDENSAKLIAGGVFMGGSDRMTVDFLGMEPASHLCIEENRSHGGGNMIGLRYSDEHQSLHNMH